MSGHFQSVRYVAKFSGESFGQGKMSATYPTYPIFWRYIQQWLKTSRNLGTGTKGSSDLQIHNNQSMRKTALTNSFLKTSLNHRKKRVTGRRRTLENGVISTKALGTASMNVAQNSHWWPRLKTRSRTLTQNLILKILVRDKSSMQTPLVLS
jgi:hypothetical protein